MRKRIIITGAMGQDGKILSNILLKNNYSVIGLIKKKQLYKRIKKVKYFNVNLLHYDPIYKINQYKEKIYLGYLNLPILSTYKLNKLIGIEAGPYLSYLLFDKKNFTVLNGLLFRVMI